MKIISDGPLQTPKKAAKISRSKHKRDAPDKVAKNMKNEVEGFETHHEEKTRTKKPLIEEKERYLSKKGGQEPQLSWINIFKKFSDEGHRLNKRVKLALIISLSLSLFGGLSIVGLLQPSGGVTFSGLVVQPRMHELGTVQAGGLRVQSAIFDIKNTNDEAVTLTFATENWSPAEASDYVEISWDYDGSPIEPGHGVGITFTLVDSSTIGLENFSFDIIFSCTVS